MPDATDLAVSELPSRHRRPRWVIPLTVAIATLIGLAALVDYVVGPAIASHSELAVGSPAPALSLRDPSSGAPETVSTTGPIVVEFFNTTCPDCAAEVPALCRLLHSHPGLQAIGVEVGGHSETEISSFLTTSGNGCLKQTRYRVLSDRSGAVSSAYHVIETPTTYLLAGGRVRAASTGNTSLTGIAAALG